MTQAASGRGLTRWATDPFDKVFSLRGEVGGKVESSVQDLVDGLASVFSTEWWLQEHKPPSPV